MWWIQILIDLVGNAALFFMEAAFEVGGWVWPFYLLEAPLYGLYKIFWSWRASLFDFNDWADDVWDKVLAIWDADGILGLIKWWFPWLYDIGEWFVDRWQWFTTEVGNWWDATKTTVLGWIDMATEGLNALIVWWDEFWTITWPKWMSTLEVLGSQISDFFTNTLPGLFNVEYAAIWWIAKLLDVAGLIDSSFVERKGFWEGWQDMKGKVFEFFEDPLEFLLTLFTDWFLGPEE